MSSKIRILPERVANMIAAGEVVSRPASVVKELVENSLDAGAADIRVEVRHGGKRLIRVADDGAGMGRDDALLCLEQHATSKVAGEEDLLNIDTLGFRGEALPAIASVSKMRISTRPADRETGASIVCEGGRIKEVVDAGLPRGTEVVAENLFFNTPARRKFLKSPETELGHVVDVVTQMSVAHPSVRFDLNSNGRPLLRVPPAKTVAERIGLLLGDEAARSLVPVETDSGFLRVTGFAGKPPFSRASMKYVFAYVNRRFIKDRLVNHAVLEAYRGRLLKGRYPVVGLFLELPAHRVDVNVHPAKAEVRFREPSMVHEAVAAAVDAALSEGRDQDLPANRTQEDGNEGVQEERMAGIRAAIYEHGRRTLAASGRLDLDGGRRSAGLVQPRGSGDGMPEGDFRRVEEGATSEGPKLRDIGRLRSIGQIASSYLVCQSEAGMVLIDQHAAHERVLFERFRKEHLSGRVPSQSLLFPVTFEFPHREADLLRGALAELDRLGIGIEDFGQRAFALKDLPLHLDETACRELVRDIVDDLATYEKSGRLDDLVDGVISRLACRSAIKAGQSLAEPEAQEILTGLARSEKQENCPHGRPAFLVFSPEDLEKMFLRR